MSQPFKLLRSGRAASPVLAALPVVLALFLYRGALSLTFYWDDPGGHLLWLEGRSAVSILTSAEGIAFWRPLPMLVWKLLRFLMGRFDPFSFHLLSVLVHALNVLLVWLLALHLSRRRVFATLASSLFAAFPLSYEAVAYVGGFFHPLATAFVLAAFLLYLQFRHRNRVRDLGLSVLCFVLALLSHENALVLPLLLLAYEAVQTPIRPREALARLSPYFVASLLFLVVWSVIPKQPRFAGIPPLQEMATNLLFALQGWVYPLAYHVRSLAATIGWTEAPTLLLLTGIFTAVLFLVARITDEVHLGLWAGLWTALPMLPTIALLSSGYVVGGARLFYLSSVGVALMWAFILDSLIQFLRRPALLPRTAALVALLLATGLIARPVQAVLYCNLDSYHAVAEVLGEVEEIASQTDPDRTLTLVNLPLYTTSLGERGPGCVNPFPYGPSGVLVIPPYPHWVDDYLAVRDRARSPVETLRVEAFGLNWVTYGDSVGLDRVREALLEGSATYVFDLRRWGFFDLSAHWSLSGSQSPARAEAPVIFGGLMALADHHMEVGEEEVQVDLRWRALEKPTRSYTVFVHIWNPLGKVLAQDDAMPAENYLPTVFWDVGDEIVDPHVVVLPTDLPPDHYWVAVGVYDSETVTRLPAESPAGERYGGDLYVIGEFDSS